MLLADLGNTRAKFYRCIGSSPVFIGHWHYENDPSEVLRPFTGESLWFASVTTAEINARLQSAAQACQIDSQMIETASSEHGVINGYQKPTQLGVDRWLALVGARTLTKHACLVVDAGTAMTIDLLNEHGEHLGGWIIPSQTLMVEALLSGTAALEQSASSAELAFGNATEQGIANGTFAALSGAIRQALAVAQQQLSQKRAPEVILSGGYGTELARAIPDNCRVVPDLVILGLLEYAKGK